jgi:hypothetical protein
MSGSQVTFRVYGAANKHTISYVTFASQTITVENYYFPDIKDLTFNTLGFWDRKAKENDT